MNDLSNTIFVTGSVLIGSFFSYLLQFFLGRTLDVSDYGVFNALLSIGAIVGVPAAVFGTAIIKKVATLKGENNNDKISALYWQGIIWTVVLAFISGGFFYFYNESIANALHITNSSSVTSFGLFFALSILFVVPSSYLQGLLKYKNYGVVVVLGSLLRFGLAFWVMLYFKSVSNIFISMSVAILLAIFLTQFFLRKDLTGDFKKTSVRKDFIDILKFSWPVMAVNLSLMAFNNNDMIFVRANFPPEQSGYYAGVATLGKILLFGSLSVSTVMFPRISAAKANLKETKSLFFKYFKMQSLVVGLGIILFTLAPKLIATLFFGEKFLSSVVYLPLYSVFIGAFVILNFLILFLFAVDITKFYDGLILIAMMHYVALVQTNSTLNQVIYVDIAAVTLALLVTFYHSYKFLKNS